MVQDTINVYVMVSGNTLGSHKEFMKDLLRSTNLRVVKFVDDCDYIICFVPIVSRAGTDIEAALHKIPELPRARPVVLVVLHHTFDPDFVAPDSSRSVHNSNVFTVDCLHHEDQGMLKCIRNSEALQKVKERVGAQEEFPDLPSYRENPVIIESNPEYPNRNLKVKDFCERYKWAPVWVPILLLVVLLIIILPATLTQRSH
ncbi:uncharacterized protein [Hoplias malabaricus]|uniref:uncharacterized protein n=1 Tax=Hoplias malabaricus TaxID=27720 RepID=UPI003461AE2A